MKEVKTNSKEFYSSISGLELVANCTQCTLNQWEKYMKDAKRANKREIHKLLKRFMPELYENLFLGLYNPYNYFKTESMIIVVHSGIEYFIEIH